MNMLVSRLTVVAMGVNRILILVCPLLDIMKLRLRLLFQVNEIEMLKEQSHNKAIQPRLSRSDLNQSQGQATLSEMSGRSQDTAHRTWLQATIRGRINTLEQGCPKLKQEDGLVQSPHPGPTFC